MAAGDTGNLCELLIERTREAPGRCAIVDRHGTLTYAELEALTGHLAAGLARAGVSRGDRVAVLLPVSRELYLVLIALLRAGATAVFAEPALGPIGILRACERAAPRAFIGVPRAHLLRLASPTLRRVPLAIVTGRMPLPGARPLDALVGDQGTLPIASVDAATPALLTFTSGTGGPAKMLPRGHALLRAQHEVLLRAFPVGPEDRGFSAAPLFALHDLAAGATVVLPPGVAMGRVRDPGDLVRWLARNGASVLRLDPGTAAAIAGGCEEAALALGAVRALFVGGAPVGAALVARLRIAVPHARIYVAYGSSEAEPISAIEGDELIAETAALTDTGGGFCVGAAVPPTALRVDGANADGDIGEISVSGPHVNAAGWHRTGDTGYRDPRGRIWLLGRESDRVHRAGVDLHPYAVEPLVGSLPFVERCALVGAPDPLLGERALLAVVARGPARLGSYLRRGERERTIRTLCAAHAIPIDEIRWVRRLPLDRRHRSKVRRGELRRGLAARPGGDA